MKEDENNRLKKLFSDFEPEVSDARISERWEEMKYFLPQEKKRRGIAYLWGCLGLVTVFTAIFFVMWLMFDRDASSSQPVQRAGKQEKSRTVSSYQGADAGQPPSPKSGQLQKALPPPQEFSKASTPVNEHSAEVWQQPMQKAVQPSHFPSREPEFSADSKSINENARHYERQKSVPEKMLAPAAPFQSTTATAYSKKQETTVIETLPPKPSGTMQEMAPELQDSIHAVSPAIGSSAWQDSSCYLPLLAPHASFADTMVPALSVVQPTLPSAARRRSFCIQVFGGPVAAFTRITTTGDSAHNYKQLESSAGLAIGYQMKNKFSFNAQLEYSHTALNYQYKTVFSGDTNYVSANAVLHAVSAYNLGLGMGYQLLHRGRFDINGLAMLSLHLVKYSVLKNDSLAWSRIYMFTGAHPVQQKLISTVSAGLGVTAACRLYRNFYFIARPLLWLQLPDDRGNVDGLAAIRRNQLSLNVGIQLKLK